MNIERNKYCISLEPIRSIASETIGLAFELTEIQ